MPRAASPKRNDRMKTVTDPSDHGDYNTTGYSEKSYKRQPAGVNTSQYNPLPKSQGTGSIFERLHEESKIKQQFKQQIEEIKILNELKDCTF